VFEFYFSELAHLVSDEIQILLHAFFLSFVVSVNLSYNELGTLCIFSLVAPSTLANLSPFSSASYSASLLVVVYCSHTACLMVSPSGDFSIMPIPPTFFVDDLSM
jgi:hypothetical protein